MARAALVAAASAGRRDSCRRRGGLPAGWLCALAAAIAAASRLQSGGAFVPAPRSFRGGAHVGDCGAAGRCSPSVAAAAAGGTAVLEPPVVEEQEAADASLEERRQVQRLVKKYGADDGEAWQTFALTMLFWGAGLGAIHVTGGNWAAVLFTALSIMRCFMVFHDAAHLSFFESVDMNRSLANFIQFFVNYSQKEWDAVHNPHHAHFGDPTVKDSSLTIWFSEEELKTKPLWLQAGHRIIRDPILFYPLAGLFVFFLNKPLQQSVFRWTIPLIIYLTLGWQTLTMYLVAAWIAAMGGVACFHIQHHCNQPYRVAGPKERTALDAAILGSTYVPVAFPFSLFSLGIEFHHIHHFDVRVPGYRLARCHEEGEELGLWKRINRVEGGRLFKSLFHTQFEGSRKHEGSDGSPARFVSFWPYSALGLQDA